MKSYKVCYDIDGVRVSFSYPTAFDYTPFSRMVYNAVIEISQFGNTFLLKQLAIAVYKTTCINFDMLNAVINELESLSAIYFKYTAEDVVDAIGKGIVSRDEYEAMCNNGIAGCRKCAVLSYGFNDIMTDISNTERVITIYNVLLPIRFVEYCMAKT